MHYRLFVVLLFCFLLIANNYKKSNLFQIAIVLLVVFAGVRDPFIYPDIEEYLIYFKTEEFSNGSTESVNIGYNFLSKVVYTLTGNFYFFSILVTCIIVFLYAWFISKFSPNKNISVFIYVLTLYFSSFFLLRQCLAMAFSLIAFNYVIERKLNLFLFWVLVAVSFHTSAVVILPVYYVYIIPWNRRTIFCLIIGSIVAIIGLKTMAQYILMFSTYYSAGYLDSDYQASYSRIAMKIVYMIVLLYSLGSEFKNKNIGYFVFICCLFEVVLYLGTAAAGIEGVYRIRLYFDIGEIIGLPFLWVYSSKYHQRKKLTIRFITISYVLLQCLSCDTFVNTLFERGYKTFF